MATYETLPHNVNNSATGGIWRVTDGPLGRAVYKICTPSGDGTWETSSHTSHWNYWRREVHAYESGLTDSAFGDAGIAGPKLLEVTDLDDGAVGLWLEDVRGVEGFDWSIEQLGRFAQRLGAGQAAWANRDLPEYPWLSHGWLRRYVSRLVPAVIPWDHPDAVRVWPDELRDGLRHITERRDDYIRATETAPRTLCHLDVWPMNLIASQSRTVLLDWSFVGNGALGEDPANLIVDSVADGHIATELLPEITEAVVEGYLQGLKDGGWRGEPANVRATIAAAGVAKYCWLAPLMLNRLAQGAPIGSATYDIGGDNADVLRRRRDLMEHLVRWAAVSA